MSTLDQFLNRHRAQLQHFLDDDSNILKNHSMVLRFVDLVLDDWDKLKRPSIPAYTREEMTFWYCLYQLESVSEIPADLPMMPFEEMMFDTLRTIRELLRTNQPLPEHFYATRPGFMLEEQEDDVMIM